MRIISFVFVLVVTVVVSACGHSPTGPTTTTTTVPPSRSLIWTRTGSSSSSLSDSISAWGIGFRPAPDESPGVLELETMCIPDHGNIQAYIFLNKSDIDLCLGGRQSICPGYPEGGFTQDACHNAIKYSIDKDFIVSRHNLYFAWRKLVKDGEVIKIDAYLYLSLQ